MYRIILAVFAILIGSSAAFAQSPTWDTETLRNPPTWLGQNGVCVANGSSPANCSNTLPSGLAIPAPTITGSIILPGTGYPYANGASAVTFSTTLNPVALNALAGGNGILNADGSVIDAQNTSVTASSIYSPLVPSLWHFFDTVRSVIDIEPGGSNRVQNADAYGAYVLVNAAEGSAPHADNGVGYFSIEAIGINNGAAWGSNFSCGDNTSNGLATLSGRRCVGEELDMTANGASIFEADVAIMQGPGTPSSANGFQVSIASGATAKWSYAYLDDDAASANGFVIGATALSGANVQSQPSFFNYFNASAVEFAMKVYAFNDAMGFLSTGFNDGISLGGSTGNPYVKVFGTDTNINLDLYAKGTGNVIAESPFEIIGMTIAGVITNNSSGLLSSVTQLAASLGGSGIASPTAHALMIAEGGSAFNLLAAATGGRMLLDQGSGSDPAYEVMSGDGALATNGALTVSKIGGIAISLSASLTTNGAGSGLFNFGSLSTIVAFPSGSNDMVAELTQTQTLTNKTLTDPTHTPQTIAHLTSLGCAAGNKGQEVFVSDTVGAATPTYHLTVAGGGATTVNSFATCNGSVWQYN